MASRRLRVVVNSLEDFLDQLIKKIVLDIVANLRRAPSEGGTPVDTGWARANWLPSIGAPLGPGDTSGIRPETPNSASTTDQDSGLAKVATTYQTEKGPVHITNNVPYIVFLNEGSSKQAPSGFVQRAIRKAIIEDLPGSIGPTPTPPGTPPKDPVTGGFLRRRG
jgi:hypothetical protein